MGLLLSHCEFSGLIATYLSFFFYLHSPIYRKILIKADTAGVIIAGMAPVPDKTWGETAPRATFRR